MEEQLRKAFEDTTIGNLRVIKEYTKDTRELFRELQEELKGLKNLFLTREEEIRQLKIQVAKLLAEKYIGGTQ